MSIKMIVSDLDGTLVNSYKEGYKISSKLIEEIHNFERKGKIFTIATGRSKEAALSVIKELDISFPYIVYNGAEIIDKGGNQIYSDTFLLKTWILFLDRLQELGASVIFSYDGQIFCLKYTDRISVYEKKEMIKCEVIDKSLLDSNIEVNKILIIGDVEKYKQCWNELDEISKSEFRYVISEDDYMEILTKGISKGSALKKLKEYLNIKDEEVVTIGNHMNDKELIEEAHIGVAVANAVDGLKNIANIITDGEYEEGVIEVIKKFA
ncbi:HAD family hydrolase [Clostridium pasteurianum]|uniref:HAD family hydrolase n=1 Tax=Clostridium pasteurianum TaxID=1501 RepID=UPI002260D7AB|nr:HAD family hydrolase [Clostridium pasteurianum]UZW13495.1 HAD family hydrolase [Clostridium pasteurianum]